MLEKEWRVGINDFLGGSRGERVPKKFLLHTGKAMY